MKSKALLSALLFLSTAASAEIQGLPGASGNPAMDRHVRSSTLDKALVRERVDESQALLDGLARETRGLSKEQVEPLFKSLKTEYYLGDYAGKLRKAVEQAEAVLDVQDAVKAQQALMKSKGASDVKEGQKDDSKLLGLQSDLVSAVDSLRGTLRTMLSECNEDTVRDINNWLMISEGLLRQHREEAAAAMAASPTAEAQTPTAEVEMSAAGITPPAGVQAVSPTATTVPTITAVRAGSPRPAPAR